MLIDPITAAQSIADHELALQELRDLVARDPVCGSMQLIPTGSFWVNVGSSRLASVVSLLSAPAPPWEANREHWFGAPSVDFAELLGTKEDLIIEPHIHCGTVAPCKSLLREMAVLASLWSKDFQMYALGELTPNAWEDQAPVLAGKIYAFDSGGADPERPRIVFDVNPIDTTKLDRIVWLTDDKNLSTYPLTTLKLSYVGDSLPEAKYYYTASR